MVRDRRVPDKVFGEGIAFRGARPASPSRLDSTRSTDPARGHAGLFGMREYLADNPRVEETRAASNDQRQRALPRRWFRV